MSEKAEEKTFHVASMLAWLQMKYSGAYGRRLQDLAWQRLGLFKISLWVSVNSLLRIVV